MGARTGSQFLEGLRKTKHHDPAVALKMAGKHAGLARNSADDQG
jgi:hypothetical protein